MVEGLYGRKTGYVHRNACVRLYVHKPASLGAGMESAGMER